VGKLIEALHKAVYCVSETLSQRQQVIKGSRALVPALEHINKLFAEVLPRVRRTPRKMKQPVASRCLKP
jgi:hypothetical protein